ncbi:MAG: DUF1800 domain-containing protein [Candidatus Thioglobus sp.]|nr:DUF1800 domain-containing protein [Candidatus Thioglobus sp.]
MIKLISLVFLLCVPAFSYAISIEDARHLWSRTGFSSADFILNNYSDNSKEESVSLILDSGAYTIPVMPLLKFDDNLYLQAKNKNIPFKDRRKLKRSLKKSDRKRMVEWWHREILSSDNALQEKMVVFWHSHFAAQPGKVLVPYMVEQNQIFRKNSLGSFKAMLKDVMHNPTIHQFLDNTKNTVKKPNENLARELLELYTMGEGGHYSEEDIKNLAKALSGISDDYNTKKTKVNYKRKDNSFITLFGHTGSIGMDKAIELILDHPNTSKFIALKLWREFVSSDPSSNKLNQLSGLFYESDYNIKTLVSEILNSTEFWSENNRNNMIKSPFDLIASSKIIIDFPSSDLLSLPAKMQKSGQKLFEPPDVNGWLGGRRWINSDLIIARQVLLGKYIKKVVGFYKKVERNPNALEKAVDRAESEKYQYFAIGSYIENNTNDHLHKRIKSVLLDHRFNFK